METSPVPRRFVAVMWPNQVCYPTDWLFASGCSPQGPCGSRSYLRLSGSQLFCRERTCTSQVVRLRRRTRAGFPTRQGDVRDSQLRLCPITISLNAGKESAAKRRKRHKKRDSFLVPKLQLGTRTDSGSSCFPGAERSRDFTRRPSSRPRTHRRSRASPTTAFPGWSLGNEDRKGQRWRLRGHPGAPPGHRARVPSSW